ncbi:MAG: hypothetical protein BWY32_03798 [bacterium ADurb.Bin243]|nr:MAG: hypothetical protein BWY32_03798 [bacterium ADurb.Bin243]
MARPYILAPEVSLSVAINWNDSPCFIVNSDKFKPIVSTGVVSRFSRRPSTSTAWSCGTLKVSLSSI